MKKLILSLALCILLSGCAKARLETVLEDGRPISIEYVRWFNQNIDGFKLTAPDGWELSFDHQESDIEVAFKLGALSVSTGDSK
jgi:hypothetical protein